MKILFLNSFPQWGGDEKWTLICLHYLKERGHQVYLSCLPGSPLHKKAIEAGLEVFPLSLKIDTAFWKVIPLRRFLLQKQIDVFVGVQNRDIKIGAMGARLAGIPAIFSRQGLDVLKKKIDHRISFTRFIDGIITNAQAIKNLYLGYGWFRDDFIHVVYDGIEPLPSVEPSDIRAELNLAAHSPIIFSAGRLSFQKGFDLLIQAARQAKDQGLDWQFLIAGEGKLKEKLSKMSRSLQVNDLVHFLGFRQDMLPLLKTADIFVLSSRSEGMPNVLREAMAMGRACVATAVNGVPELIESGKSGILVEKENAAQLFEAINRVLGDDQLRISLGENACRRVKEYFTIENMIDRLEVIFTDQLTKSEKAGSGA